MVSVLQIINKIGNCIECGSETNIQLDCGKYACMSCLNIIGKQTKNVREYVENMQSELPWYSTQERCNGLIKLLKTLKNNEITSIDNAIKTLEAINIYNEYKLGLLDEEKVEFIEKQLDIFDIL